MRRVKFLLLAVLLIQACAPAVPEATPTPTVTLPPSETPAPTATSTITPSPTIVRIPTRDPEEPTPTVPTIALFIGSATITPFATPGSTRPGPGFERVAVSLSRIYWGNCKMNNTVITTDVEDPQEVASVIIFTKVRSSEDPDDMTPWTTGNVMVNNNDGTFTYRMYGSDVEGHNHYLKSWIMFQLVATNWQGEEVGRTRIYSDVIQMSPCLCYDPSTGCPPTPVKTKKP